METTQSIGQVASATPGRVRVRLSHATRELHQMRRIQAHVQGQDGVTGVVVNPATGSVLVHFDRQALTLSDVLAMFRDLGIVIKSVVELNGEPVPIPGRSNVSAHLVAAIDDFDRRLSRLTGHTVDLRFLFPLGLFALGVRQLIREGLGLADVPGYILLWYAFDSFWKFHHEPRSPVPATATLGNGAATAAPTADAVVTGHA